MKKNKIIFEALTENIFNVREKPVPASKIIPDWWKEIPKYSSDNKLVINPKAGVTVKQCAPTIDIFKTGYIITLWADIFVTQTENGPYVQWTAIDDVVSVWPEQQVSNFEIPNEYSNAVFKYLHGWIIKTPPGYSTMFVNPFGYKNLPINFIPGIVDTDILKTDIACPFVIKKGFEGIIKKGTPMFQLIPFKREEWESDIIFKENNEHSFEYHKLATEIYGYYSSRRAKKIYK